MSKPNPKKVIKSLVQEGRLDEDTAAFLQVLMAQALRIRNSGPAILGEYRVILNAISSVRDSLNVVLDNITDVENLAEED